MGDIMNIKLIALMTAMTMSAAVAQDYEDDYEEESAPAAQSAPAQESFLRVSHPGSG